MLDCWISIPSPSYWAFILFVSNFCYFSLQTILTFKICQFCNFWWKQNFEKEGGTPPKTPLKRGPPINVPPMTAYDPHFFFTKMDRCIKTRPQKISKSWSFFEILSPIFFCVPKIIHFQYYLLITRLKNASIFLFSTEVCRGRKG